MRSLNNLLERFHQSFFFYLLPATERYVSLGVYLPPFGVLCLPVIIKIHALALWIGFSLAGKKTSDDSSQAAETSSQDKESKEDKTSVGDEKKGDKTAKGDEKKGDKTAKGEEKKGGTSSQDVKKKENKSSQGDEQKEQGTEQRDPDADSKSLLYLLSHLPYFLMPLFFGLLAFYGPQFFISTAKSMHLTPQAGMAIGLLAVHFAVLSSPVFLRWKLKGIGKREKLWPKPDVRVLKCFALLMLGIALGVTSVLNISLSFFVAVLWVPVALLVSPSRSRLWRLFLYLILIIVSPLGLACIAAVVRQTVFSSSSSSSQLAVGDWMSSVWEEVGKGLYDLVVQSELLDNWTYSLMTLTLLPDWVLFTLIVSSDPPDPIAV